MEYLAYTAVELPCNLRVVRLASKVMLLKREIVDTLHEKNGNKTGTQYLEMDVCCR